MVNEVRDMLGSAKSTSIFNAGLLRALSMLICIVNLQEEYSVAQTALTTDAYFSGYSKVLQNATWKCLSRGMALSHW